MTKTATRERTHCCAECSMLVPSERPIFHPHVYCMLYKAGIRDPEKYMRATMPLLLRHFPDASPEEP